MLTQYQIAERIRDNTTHFKFTNELFDDLLYLTTIVEFKNPDEYYSYNMDIIQDQIAEIEDLFTDGDEIYIYSIEVNYIQNSENPDGLLTIILIYRI